MRRHRKSVVFITAALLVNMLLYMLFTVNGFAYLYEASKEFFFYKIEPGDDGNADPFGGFELLGDAFRTKLIFCGRAYGDTKNLNLLIGELADYMTDNKDLKYIVTDMGFSEARLVNLYYSTGNSSYKREALNGIKSAGLDYVYYAGLIDAIDSINSKLYGAAKLQFVGIGAYTSTYSAAMYVSHLIESSGVEPNAQIAPAVNSDPNEPDLYTAALSASLAENETLYRSLLTDKFFYFRTALSCAASGMVYSDSDSYNTRYYAERLMTDTFTICYGEFIRGKYLMIFGMNELPELIEAGLEDDSKRLYTFEIVDTGNEGIYIVNNRAFKYIEAYKGFVYALNGKDYTGWQYITGDVFFSVHE